MVFKLFMEEIKTTALMRGFGVFEKSKFTGKMFDGETAQNCTAAEILAKLTSIAKTEGSQDLQESVRPVGVIVPNGDAAFLPGYEIYSTGDRWATVASLCEQFNAKLVPA